MTSGLHKHPHGSARSRTHLHTYVNTHTTLTYVHMQTACFHIVCSTKESISTLLLDALI